jgi:hypothetical protein
MKDLQGTAGFAPPKTLTEAVDRLLLILTDDEKSEIASTPKADLIPDYHFSLGLSIRNAYQLHDGNPELLASCGMLFADNASAVIMAALWTRLCSSNPDCSKPSDRS